MNPPSLPQPQSCYTAAQIASALGVSKRTILHRLRAGPASSSVIVNGHVADAWRTEALPSNLLDELQAIAARRGCRNVWHLLSLPKSWQPVITWNAASEESRQRALKLQTALSGPLSRANDLSISESEFKRLALEDYKRVYGFCISERHWRRIWDRTLERDCGAENFDRLEIYLDERGAKERAAKQDANPLMVNPDLQAVIKSFRSVAQPTADEEAALWMNAFRQLDRAVEQGEPAKKVKKRLIGFLFSNAPFLAVTLAGLKRQFERKLLRWNNGGKIPSAITDKRHAESGYYRAPALSKDDKDALVARAVLTCGGRVSQAWREAQREGELSESLTEYYSTKPASKSHVPRGIRERLKYEITSLADIHRGTRTADLNGAFIERDHSSYSAGDWYQADDCTLPIYYYEPDGQGWYHLMRGQCLVMIDVRSTRILNFTLISERNYNSIAIRGLMARACDEHGLPRRGFDFECGIWKNAKLIKGNSPHDVEISSSDVEKGFGDLGLEFRHRYFPRTKPVEGVLGAIQNLMEGEPGYCGRDERKDKFQRMEEYARLVRSKKAEPKLYFYSAEQWLARISKICENYNSEVQNGKRLPNLSPEQGFENFRNAADPQTKLDGACSYLLATHRRPVRVTKNGIRLALPGKRIFTYRNQDTGRLIGQNVLAWFNPERADIITITDLNRQNAFAIARSQAVPAYDAPPEMLSREMALAAGHNSYAKTYYRELKAKFAPKFRRNLVDPDVQHLGVEVRKNEAALNTRITEERQTVSKSQKAARRLGITLTDDAARSNGTAESATRLKDLLDRIDEPETSL